MLPALAGGLAVVTLVLTVVVVRLRSRAGRDLVAARAESAELRERVAGIEQQLAEADPGGPGSVVPGFVITDLGDRPGHHDDAPAAPPGRIDGRLFADLVLRESVVKAAALAHGLRRAWAPETRDRIRVEIRRGTKRSRRQRRQEERAARRRLQAQRRATGRDAA